MDSQVKLWDIRTASAMSTLTNHKKGVRAVKIHPNEFSFTSVAADNIKKWKLPTVGLVWCCIKLLSFGVGCIGLLSCLSFWVNMNNNSDDIDNPGTIPAQLRQQGVSHQYSFSQPR